MLLLFAILYFFNCRYFPSKFDFKEMNFRIFKDWLQSNSRVWDRIWLQRNELRNLQSLASKIHLQSLDTMTTSHPSTERRFFPSTERWPRGAYGILRLYPSTETVSHQSVRDRSVDPWSSSASQSLRLVYLRWEMPTPRRASRESPNYYYNYWVTGVFSFLSFSFLSFPFSFMI